MKDPFVIWLLSLAVTVSHANGCADPLDKVYAIYPLFTNQLRELPAIDYSRDKLGLYEDFTRATIKMT